MIGVAPPTTDASGWAAGRALLGVLETEPSFLAPTVAWMVLAPVLFVAVRGAIRARLRSEGPIVVAGAVAGLLLRLVVPWGPMNFVEPSRVAFLWSGTFGRFVEFSSLQLAYAFPVALGLPAAVVYRALPPVFGALGVVLTYVLARVLGLGRGASAIAMLVVLGWPQHVRYSASASFVVEGAALACACLAAASARSLPVRPRTILTAVLAVLLVQARPELRLFLPVLAIAVSGPSWPRRERAILGGLLLPALFAYAPVVANEHASLDASMLGEHVDILLRSPGLSPTWWTVAGIVGVAAGRFEWRARAAVGLPLALLLVAFTVAGHEANPLWGNWRYYVELVPFLAIGAAALVERLPPRPVVVVALAALALADIALYRGLLGRPTELQAQFRFVHETAPEVLRDRVPLVLSERGSTGPRPPPENVADLALFGVGLRRPLAVAGARACRATTAAVPIEGQPFAGWAYDQGVERCVGGRGLLFLGAYRTTETEAALAAGRLVPLLEVVREVAPSSPAQDTQCASGPVVPGVVVADCPVKFGWYAPVEATRVGPSATE